MTLITVLGSMSPLSASLSSSSSSSSSMTTRRGRTFSVSSSSSSSSASSTTSSSSSSWSSCVVSRLWWWLLGGSGGGSHGDECRLDLVFVRKQLLLSLLVFVVGVTIYWNSLDGDFVHDDHVSILRNQDVRPNSPWTNLFWNDYWGMEMGSVKSCGSYRPLTVLTYRANFALSNLSAFAFHATNMGIHGAVSSLLFLVSTSTLRMSLTSSFTASFIFATHPVHSEAVAGITGRADALACLLILVSFYLYARSLSQNDVGRGGISWNVIASGMVGCCAMLAKETGITVMGINILYDLYLHMDLVKRWLFLGLGNKWKEDQCQRRLRRRLTFMVALTSLSLGLRLALMQGTFPRFSQQDNPAAYSRSETTRFLTYAFLPVFHFWLILCPYRLSYDWQMGSVPLVTNLWDSRNLASLLFYTSFLALVYRAIFITTKKGKNGAATATVAVVVVTAVLFISFPFLPASNLFFPVGFVAAERVLYTPSIGVCILTAQGLELLKKRLPTCRKFFISALCLMLMSLSLRTWDRNRVWRSRATLFESGLRENPGNAKMHYNYANLQKDLGNVHEAAKHYNIAISLWPNYASAHNNLGALSEDMSTAENCFLRAIQANPQHNGAHFNLGVIYMRRERYEDSLRHLEESLRIDPWNVAAALLGASYNFLNKTRQLAPTPFDDLNVEMEEEEAVAVSSEAQDEDEEVEGEGEEEEAEGEDVFRKLITSDLPPSELHTNFAIFLQELGLPSETLSHYLLAKKKEEEEKAVAKARQQKKKGGGGRKQLKFQQLFQQLSQQLLSLKFDPGGADSFYKIHYAQILMQVRGGWSEAEATLKGIPASDPHHPSSLLLLAQLYESLNKTEDALDILHVALGLFCPHQPNLCSQFHTQLGNLMHTTGAVLDAANYYDMAIKFNPNSVQAHTNIGAIYHLMSNYQRAHFHYDQALKIEPSNQVVLSNMKKLQRAQESQQQQQQASSSSSTSSTSPPSPPSPSSSNEFQFASR